jgi:hypothetical protein
MRRGFMSRLSYQIALLTGICLGALVGFSGSLPYLVIAIAVLVNITYWLQAFTTKPQRTIEKIIDQSVRWIGGWRIVALFFGVATSAMLICFSTPAYALLDNARTAATNSLDAQLGAGAVDFFFGGLLLIFFFVIAGALLAGGVQVSRSENPGVFFLVALVFAMILGALEFFDKIIFTAGAGGP